MRVYEAIAEAVVAEQVDVVFGLMSEDNMNLIVEMREKWSDRLRLVNARHEQNAVAMADGYSRATGRVGVCSVGRGPGIAQTGTTFVGAKKRRSKILVIVPDAPVGKPHDIKRFDQVKYLESVGVRVVPCRTAATVAEDLALAFKLAQDGEGPVAFNIPWDILDGTLAVDAWHYTPSTLPVTAHDQRIEPDAEKIAEAAAWLASTERPPIIVAGRGAVASGAKAAIEALAERLGALLATTLQAKDYFADHPYNLGIMGTFATEAAADFFRRSECVLAVGCSLNTYTTHDGGLLRNTRVIQIDNDPRRIEAVTPVDLGIVADAKTAVEALIHQLDADGINRSATFWTQAVREQIAASPPIEIRKGDFPEMPDTVDPREFVVALDRILPPNKLLVTDGGHFVRWVIDGIRIDHPDDMIWTLDFAGIGQGLGNGIGAAMARPDRPVVVICGDAGFMMAVQEVETAVRYNVPLTIIVMNDEALGSEYQNLVKLNRPTEMSVVTTPDLADVARAMGARGLTVRSIDEVPAIAEHMDYSGKQPPLVVDVRVNRHVMHRSK